MSSIVVVDAAEQELLDAYMTAAALGGGHRYRLYTNDVTAGLTDDQIDQLTAGSFTEAAFTGYAAVTRNGGWTYTQGNPTLASNTVCTFTRTSTGTPVNVRGYYVTKVTGGALAWFEQFDGPIVVEFNGDAIQVTPRISIDDSGGNNVEAGTIVMTGRTTAPTGWLLCNGSAVSRSTYAGLFAAIGTAYGTGDGSTTFNVPDMRQRFPLGKANSGTGATLGGTGGAIDHTHPLDSATSHARITVGNFSVDDIFNERKSVSSWTADATEAATAQVSAQASTLATRLGGNSDVANPPFQTVNFMVKT